MRERLGREVPTDLESLIMRGLAKSPADRPQSAAAFREALLRCEVTPWTQEDARAWWRTHGERARRTDGLPSICAHAPTVTLVRERALRHRLDSCAPHDLRTTRLPCRRMSRVGRSAPATRSSIAASAAAPICRVGCRKVVSGTGSRLA